MEKIKRIFSGYRNTLSLNTKYDKGWFIATFVLLVLYTEIVVSLHFSYFERLFSSLHVVFTIAIVPFVFIIVWILARINCITLYQSACNTERSKKRFIFPSVVFGLTLAYFLLWFIAFYPGSFSNDSFIQYEQVVSGEYNNWHPVLHTWLFFTLPVAIFDNIAMAVMMQIIYFSLAITYLLYTLKRSGCPLWFILISWGYVISNPNTAHILLYPWKDTALTIFATVIFTHLIRIYETGGKWLKKATNMFSFAIFLFLAIGMRHNSILLVAPLLVIIFVFIKNIRKNIIAVAGGLLLASLLLSGPVFKLAGVEKPGHRQIETLGLPLTVLSDVYMYDREALGDEAITFMDSLATKEEWEKYHSSGNFNVLKFSVDESVFDKVEEESAIKILGYTAEAVASSPAIALRAFSRLTCLVWGVAECGDNTIPRAIIDNPYGVEYSQSTVLTKLLSLYSSVVSVVGKYLFNFVGILNAIMLFTAVARIGKCGLQRAFIVIAPMAYNFGTMLLLTGPDFRFFYFNFLIIIPMIYLFFTKKDPKLSDCEVSDNKIIFQ